MMGVRRMFFRQFSRFYDSTKSTVYALATGSLPSALSVIRVSGPNCQEVLQKIGRFDKEIVARQVTLKKLYDPVSSNIIDHGIVVWFPAPKSFTGEDCCEFHVHGGPAVVTGLLKAIGNISGCRMAEPGEFTKRAFLNGKMDLTEVDGLADLISAETEMQRVQALKQMDGSLSRIYFSWRDRIAKCLANCEAFIDFGEDEDIESDVMDVVENNVVELIVEISNHLKDRGRGERLRNGVRVAIIGKPNVGKSTLLNYLCKRDAAIVSNIPGTTRDVIETFVSIAGYPVTFADTAGIRPLTSDEIEIEGIKRSIKELQKADLVILLVDASELQNCTLQEYKTGADLKLHLLKDLGIDLTVGDNDTRELAMKTVTVLNKLDLISTTSIPYEIFDCQISCKTSKGVEDFYTRLQLKVSEKCSDPTRDVPHVTQERYRTELENCVQYLNEFSEFPQNVHGTDLALRTNYLKSAINSIGAITGHVRADDIFDIIFRDFCIGK